MTETTQSKPRLSDQISRRGLMFVLSSPSGAGKTTLSKRLLEIDKNMIMSVSATTRPCRPGEIDGKDYFFMDTNTFTKKRDASEFLEWAKVFDNYYGTPRQFVEDVLHSGRDVLFDIDWQGCDQLRKLMPDDLVSVFILPPSAAALENRLRTRAQDSEDVVKRRMAGASNEIRHWQAYDYIIINDDLDLSLQDIRNILQAERLKRARRHGLLPFVEGLLKDLG